MQILSKSCTLQRVTVSLEDMHIVPNPLLNKYCKECRRKTEDQRYEQERVHSNGG